MIIYKLDVFEFVCLSQLTFDHGFGAKNKQINNIILKYGKIKLPFNVD